MDESKAEDVEDTESSGSAKTNGSDSSCCTGCTQTTDSSTTTTNSSNIDDLGEISNNQSTVPQTFDASNSICERLRELKHATDESKTRDESITRSQVLMGQDCDNQTGEPTAKSESKIVSEQPKASSSGSDQAGDNCALSASQHLNRFVRQTPSPSPTLVSNPPDRNNNKGSRDPRIDSLSGLRRTNFSKSASGGRLIPDRIERLHPSSPSEATMSANKPSHVCDCLAQNCEENEHSNRRQFIESYYSSRTCLPSSSATTMSSLNISTPLNRLSECDAITKRLLSSPIRAASKLAQSPERQLQAYDLGKSRRASLGTNALNDQVSLFASNQSNSLDYQNLLTNALAEDGAHEQQRDMTISPTSESDIRLKYSQGRSLSVCHEETQKSNFRDNGGSKINNNLLKSPHHYHSSNLNRAVSLACDSGSSKRLLTIIPLFGCDITTLEQFMRFGLILPPAIDSAVEHILKHGVKSFGIFRKSGVKSRILTLRQRIELNQDVELDVLNRENEFSIYDIADLVKMWFRELKPSPIMTEELIRIISGHQQQSNAVDSKQSIQPQSSQKREQNNDFELKLRITSAITPAHRALFLKTLSFFSNIASYSDVNQMTSQNLAICLTPSLCATGSDQYSIVAAQKALQFCLENYRQLL